MRVRMRSQSVLRVDRFFCTVRRMAWLGDHPITKRTRSASSNHKEDTVSRKMDHPIIKRTRSAEIWIIQSQRGHCQQKDGSSNHKEDTVSRKINRLKNQNNLRNIPSLSANMVCPFGIFPHCRPIWCACLEYSLTVGQSDVSVWNIPSFTRGTASL
jgi:hypothetical protein